MLILHVAYAFIPAGFILSALSAFDLIAPSAGIHAWRGGAIGAMTLALMSRATLGHTGWIYAAVIVAANARVCAVLYVDHTGPLLAISGFAWAAALLGFTAAYSVAFWTARVGSEFGLAAAAHEKPDRNGEKQDGENVARDFTPMWRGEKDLQATRQHHDQAMHERGDADIDGNQNCQFASRRRGSMDKFGNYRNEKHRRLRIQ